MFTTAEHSLGCSDVSTESGTLDPCTGKGSSDDCAHCFGAAVLVLRFLVPETWIQMHLSGVELTVGPPPGSERTPKLDLFVINIIFHSSSFLRGEGTETPVNSIVEGGAFSMLNDLWISG